MGTCSLGLFCLPLPSLLVMHDEGQGFFISCTFQSKFSQQLTWGCSTWAFWALCKCRTRISPARTAWVCFRTLCRWKAVLKHPSVLWVSSRHKSPWNSNLLENQTLLRVWVFLSPPHKGWARQVHFALGVVECTETWNTTSSWALCIHFRLETLWANPAWKPTDRNPAQLSEELLFLALQVLFFASCSFLPGLSKTFS